MLSRTSLESGSAASRRPALRRPQLFGEPPKRGRRPPVAAKQPEAFLCRPRRFRARLPLQITRLRPLSSRRGSQVRTRRHRAASVRGRPSRLFCAFEKGGRRLAGSGRGITRARSGRERDRVGHGIVDAGPSRGADGVLLRAESPGQKVQNSVQTIRAESNHVATSTTTLATRTSNLRRHSRLVRAGNT